ncbi:restriction endonuclease [Embleya scabrispora]|uniref:restriction endonuclease n=1 Tax=Embleya scabrispora TaxID=159449 RepID=UPI00099EADA8|nr:restriction endonuclease [Embleya scabrispora]MYS86837.1 hypothetical protein [Streptomyces sp. SID5474]
MKKSVEFEQLVARIIAELEPTATVTWDDHIIGKRSGLKRQIDVSIRRANPEFLGIVDAKDYKRPATIERIDALTGVMLDVQANYGALACSGGFAKSIHAYAKSCGISLFNVHDAKSVNWSLELKIPIMWMRLTPVVQAIAHCHFEAGDSIPSQDPYGIPVTADEGRTRIDPSATFERFWKDPDANRTVGVLHHIRGNEPLKAIVLDNQEKKALRPVHLYELVYMVEQEVWIGKFQPDECRGLVDYLNGKSFTVSHLPDSAIPMEIDESWTLIEKPDQLSLTVRGTIVVCTQSVFVSNGHMTGLEAKYIGPQENYS